MDILMTVLVGYSVIAVVVDALSRDIRQSEQLEPYGLLRGVERR